MIYFYKFVVKFVCYVFFLEKMFIIKYGRFFIVVIIKIIRGEVIIL